MQAEVYPNTRGASRECENAGMKVDRVTAEGRNGFTGYGAGYVAVNGRHIERGVLVRPEAIDDWNVASIAQLAPEHVQQVLAAKPEIVLLGSGARFAFPDPAVLAPLYAARIGVEVMDTPAACRTFNILASEGRNVVAALVVD
ncbi:hypothetical protein DSM104443_02460 [Usitatibacter rugosus]|uniref:Xcc1710-like domain-containing protein n=2 Tax=Usitatibacter rugosus TaxID=2732067 RepID=A0A6M4GWK3_9PROT|nr:hypothetical protein DSM104443_02460 [Usitatibacter rugosus]